MSRRHYLRVILVMFAAGSCYAPCEFPYYPEYTDRICQYDDVTPLMAKKVAMTAVSSLVNPPGGVICEPLAIRDITGMLLGYQVPTYHGTVLSDVDK